MRGPAPKDPAIRQRTNKASTRAVLSTTVKRRRPPLPKRSEGLEWHHMTLEWWRVIWRSPMVTEWLDADVQRLYRLAALVDQFWLDPTKELDMALSKGEQEFGLSPLSRRRLEWSIEQVEQATRKRLRPPVRGSEDDPRDFLMAVK